MANIVKRTNGNGGMTTKPSMSLGWVDDILQNTLSRFFKDDFLGFDDMSPRSQIPVNIRETDNSYEMEVVAPGLKKDEFNVNISKNTLTVSFEHKEEDKHENKHDGYLRQEYRMQSFSRSFALDDTVDVEKISAQYIDGVLRVVLPKKEGVQQLSKRIEVQ